MKFNFILRGTAAVLAGLLSACGPRICTHPPFKYNAIVKDVKNLEQQFQIHPRYRYMVHPRLTVSRTGEGLYYLQFVPESYSQHDAERGKYILCPFLFINGDAHFAHTNDSAANSMLFDEYMQWKDGAFTPAQLDTLRNIYSNGPVSVCLHCRPIPPATE